MNKKGFTLVELLAIIAILAIIISISVTAFSNTQQSIVEKQYQNIVNDILIKAQDYAHKNGFTKNITISVNDLIDKGILLPNDDGYIVSPIDQTIMNCFIIEVTYTKGEKVNGITGPSTYEAHILSEKNMVDGKCEN